MSCNMKILTEYVKELFNVRSNSDRRKKCDRYVVEYTGEDGFKYRKSYEFPVKNSHDEVLKQLPKTVYEAKGEL